MKLLFLDVDGVLNRCAMSNHGLEEDKLFLLRGIVAETGCKIVVSSTWRKHDHLLERLRKEIEIHDTTPVLESEHKLLDGTTLWTAKSRGEEINAWLAKHPEVTQFVILDDDPRQGTLLPHLVKTESSTGLTRTLATEIIRRFNQPSDMTA